MLVWHGGFVRYSRPPIAASLQGRRAAPPKVHQYHRQDRYSITVTHDSQNIFLYLFIVLLQLLLVDSLTHETYQQILWLRVSCGKLHNQNSFGSLFTKFTLTAPGLHKICLYGHHVPKWNWLRLTVIAHALSLEIASRRYRHHYLISQGSCFHPCLGGSISKTLDIISWPHPSKYSWGWTARLQLMAASLPGLIPLVLPRTPAMGYR